MQYAENIALVAESSFDKEKVNQCQGFTYNSQTEKFIVACINADSSTQILYELNKILLSLVVLRILEPISSVIVILYSSTANCELRMVLLTVIVFIISMIT